MKEYGYPLDLDWSTEEMIIVTDMWAILELAYEKNVDTKQFLRHYQKFKTVVKSIGEEKRLGKEFENLSGYSLYHAVKQAKQQQSGKLRLGDGV